LLDRLANAVRANQRATDVVDDLVGQLLGVNRTDGRILDILDQHGRMSAGELAQASSLTTGAITAVIDRLERAGYAHRVPDPDDRRRVLVELTPRTRELSWELYSPLAELWRPYSERYNDDEIRLLIDFQEQGAEIQQRHADILRERLRATATPAPARPPRGTRTAPELPSPSRESRD
jgi:DNA-binding MarR family transcriptional regulator